MNICGVAAIYFLPSQCLILTIATEIIQKQKMTCYCTWLNDLFPFARKLLIKWYIEEEIDLSDIGLECA